MRILVVEDEHDLCRSIAAGLRMEGYAVDTSENGEDAFWRASVEPYDLVLLDLNLPGMDGFSILRQLRRENPEIKVMILSARDGVEDKVAGLDLGANDYLTKPFAFAELEARVRALLRREFSQVGSTFSCGELSVDTLTHTAYAGGKPLTLTRKELALLTYLMRNKERVVGAEELIEHVWDGSADPFSNSVRVHITALRKKIRDVLGYHPIENRVGEGYIIKEMNRE